MEFKIKQTLSIQLANATVKGDLIIPEKAKSIVIFSHGSGSSRLSPRNREVAEFLHGGNMGTLLFDLLTPTEDAIPENRFDIKLLTGRLIAVTQWLEKQPDVKGCSIGYFGASTGAAAALAAAAQLPQIAAVVSRGGRPDLAGDALPLVKAPTLLIVGSLDYHVLILNQQSLERLGGTCKLEMVLGATHLFEEPGKMREVEQLAADWFRKYLP